MTDRRQNGEERRQSERTTFVAAVRHELGKKAALGLAQNLGTSGMEIHLPDGESPVNKEFSLHFELPDGHGLIEARAKLVFAYRHGKFQRAGVRFTQISTRDQARIARVVEGG